MRNVRRITGGITMYKLVVISLATIGALALVLSLFGQLPFDPLAVVLSYLVALVVTVGTGWIGARLTRTTAHLESSVITALLIFLIVPPSLDALDLLGVALASAVASASKYLLAVRGRHIFNPAAVGLLVVGLTGLAFPSWWVGTGVLLPVVALGALAIFARTRRFALGLTFIVIAVVLFGGRIMLTGGSVTDALSFALLSSPIIFFAGFMLTEPLTLPPKRWQQLLVAVVAAVLFTTPFVLGPLSNTPQLALLVANLVAFAFGQRRAIHLDYLGKRLIGPASWELSFQPTRPVRFSPGQFMELTIPHRSADFRGSRRYFSISSAPDIDAPLTFAITEPDKPSSFKRALLDLEPGARVNGTGVGGDFVLPADAAVPLLLVAGGIGITPFASQLARIVESGEHRDIVVAYSTPATEDVPFAHLLSRSGARVILFSPAPPVEMPAHWTHVSESRLTADQIAELVPDLAERRTFVSGAPVLVTALSRDLRRHGVRRVATDAFSGY